MIATLFKYIGLGALLALCVFKTSMAEDVSEQQAIEATLNNYLNGSSYNRPDQIKSAFYPESDMFLHHGQKPIYRMNSLEYAALFEKRERDVFNGRFGKILDIDISGNIATAKAEILMPKINARFFDIFILKKLDGEWKVISKAADRIESDRSGEQVLLMASKTQNLSDIIAAYESAVDNGYTVNIASPEGDTVTLSKINMTNPKHKSYLYDTDFMYALKHPLAYEDIKPENYAAAKRFKSGFWDSKSAPAKGTLYNKICEENPLCTD